MKIMYWPKTLLSKILYVYFYPNTKNKKQNWVFHNSVFVNIFLVFQFVFHWLENNEENKKNNFLYAQTRLKTLQDSSRYSIEPRVLVEKMLTDTHTKYNKIKINFLLPPESFMLNILVIPRIRIIVGPPWFQI